MRGQAVPVPRRGTARPHGRLNKAAARKQMPQMNGANQFGELVIQCGDRLSPLLGEGTARPLGKLNKAAARNRRPQMNGANQFVERLLNAGTSCPRT